MIRQVTWCFDLNAVCRVGLDVSTHFFIYVLVILGSNAPTFIKGFRRLSPAEVLK
jgi:hypothetical protein